MVVIHSEPDSYSLGDVAAIRDIFLSLYKGVKAAKQYPMHHPIAEQMQSDFFEKLRIFLQNGQPLAVEVEFDSITVDDEIVYKSGTVSENLAHVLHRDGIRALEISPDLTEREAKEFFHALVKCNDRDETAEDIVNHFWQSNFEHIKCEIVEVFDVENVKDFYSSLTHEPVEESNMNITSGNIWNDANIDQAPQSEKASRSTDSIPVANEAGNEIADLVSLSDDEKQALESLVRWDRTVDARDSVIELLMQLCSTNDSPQDMTLIVEALQSTFDKTLQECNFSGLNSIVRKAKKIIEKSGFGSPAGLRKMAEFVERCGDKNRIKMLTEVLNKNEEADLGEVRTFLSDLGWESLTHLIWMLGELAHYPARMMVCDLLVHKGLDKIDILGAAVFDSRWYVVRNVVWVLGEMRGERAMSYIRKAATNSEIRVRSEVIKALRRFDDDQFPIEILLSMMQDSSEKIRYMAISEVGKRRSPNAFAALSRIVASKEFVDSPLQEMRLTLEALVESGGSRAIPIITEITKRSTLFSKAKLRLLQETAVNALQFSETPEAIDLLTKLSAGTSSSFYQAAKKALGQLQYRMENKTNVASK